MQIQWPDGRRNDIYSPSSIIREFFRSSEKMPVKEFDNKISKALEAASSRVTEVYGYACSSAEAELLSVKNLLKAYRPDDTVEIIGFS
ncbi:MSMEG_0570 family nitrogen starvation response protein [Marinoscillum sp. MHG1-6]|uniref:MSMEG_0570 family nitrogen starvation response protein n=1 Tax=Marinoscillum sp. MHG1-6 TaxID=2959627 RepID=UPI00215856CF|nr:MSMEG_0570 family nitrogen starvation response protein [Marinoscillum sp. MHG1-6]